MLRGQETFKSFKSSSVALDLLFFHTHFMITYINLHMKKKKKTHGDLVSIILNLLVDC